MAPSSLGTRVFTVPDGELALCSLPPRRSHPSLTASYASMADGMPVLFKRKGAKHSSRARAAEVEANEGAPSDNAAGTGDDSPSVLAAKLKNKHKSRTKPKAVLSFGADEDVRGYIYVQGNLLMSEGQEGDGEVFKLKKSSLSQKLTLSKLSG